MAKFNIDENDVENEDMMDEGPPVLVMYQKLSNEAVVYKGRIFYFNMTKDFMDSS